MLARLEDRLDRSRDYAPFFVRLIVGFHLVYGSQDNVLSHERMMEFRDFIASQGFPWPFAGAWISAWAMFVCGILYIVGLWIRPAAALMIVNFVFALGIAHRQGGYPPAALALVMLFASISFLIGGAGRLSLDALRRRPGR
jgi:putative oxidoreductase